jgi:hypothetical protein
MSATRATTLGLLESAAGLRVGFDAASRRPQLLALVSPSCAVCLDGVAMILEGLDDPAGRAFEAHIVWTPVLSGDTSALAAKVAESRRGERVKHYWDDARSISDAAHLVLDLAARDWTVAWDVYLLYRTGVPWRSPLPSPTAWLHQLRIDDQRGLDADSLRSAMKAVTS